MRDVRACLHAYSLALELFDKYVTLTSAPNAHYRPDVVYTGLMQLSMSGGYAESTMDGLALRYGLDSPCGGAFLYRLKKLDRADWDSRLREVNDAVLSVASRLGLLHRPVACAVDYTKVPYYGEFNRYVTRSKHERGTDRFYEHATISVVQDGVRLCVYSRPVTLLDVKVDVVREPVEEAGRRGGEGQAPPARQGLLHRGVHQPAEGARAGVRHALRLQREGPARGGHLREGGPVALLHPGQPPGRGGVLHHGGLLEREEGEAHPLRHQ
ncbi:MAG: hypothetical protein JRN13_07550, partial [Nitrososphaerota archaeon]|nr:hypothetical protein [Nitrososphaerota archaeon]